MRSTCWLFTVVALAAALGLGAVLAPGGRSWAEEKDKADKDLPKLDEVGQAVKDIATANDLLEYARRKKDPKGLCVAVEMLMNLSDPEGGKVEVEGAGDAKAPSKKDQLLAILDEAKDCPAAGNATNKKLIAEMIDQVKTTNFKGTPNGGTTTTLTVYPDDKKDTKVVTVTRKFVGNQKGVVSWSPVANKNIPVDVQVLDPSGKVIAHDYGQNGRVEWFVFGIKETNYTIKIRNFHMVNTTTKLNTN